MLLVPAHATQGHRQDVLSAEQYQVQQQQRQDPGCMWHMLPGYVAAHLLTEQLYFQVS
jgi:hypothetical protein